MSTSRAQQIQQLEQEWKSARWEGITRPYSAEDVINLRGSVNPVCTLAQNGAAKLWELLHGKSRKGYVNSLGALTGGQALQQAKAGIEAIYLSGWQVAADANTASAMYPDQSLYPVDSVPAVVKRINNTFRRADQIQWANKIEPGSKGYTDYFLPIVADAEAGFGGVLNAFELMKAMIEAGAAGVHFEDQLAAVKKCGHMGGKVLVPTQEAIQKLVAARLAADVLGVPTLVIARTDADAADLLTSDCDHTTASLSPANVQRKVSSVPMPALSKRSAVAWRIALTPTWCGAKPPRRICRQPSVSLMPFTPNSQANCWHTTVHRRSTGKRTWTIRRLPASRKNCRRWDTSTSSSRWRASTACGSTCLTWRTLMHRARA